VAPVSHVSRNWRAHDNSSDLWFGYALRDRGIGVSLSADSRVLFLSSPNVLTGSGAQPASYPIGKGALSPEV
jgi:hypothetical protein